VEEVVVVEEDYWMPSRPDEEEVEADVGAAMMVDEEVCWQPSKAVAGEEARVLAAVMAVDEEVCWQQFKPVGQVEEDEEAMADEAACWQQFKPVEEVVNNIVTFFQTLLPMLYFDLYDPPSFLHNDLSHSKLKVVSYF
jgi:hypothetical protein